jgi:hypothetical protein
MRQLAEDPPVARRGTSWWAEDARVGLCIRCRTAFIHNDHIIFPRSLNDISTTEVEDRV